MDIIDKLHNMLHRTVLQFPLINSGKNRDFNPKMVQRPIINAGGTGRYFLDAQMVKYDAPARGTLAPNAPNAASNLASLDVTAQKAGVYGGMGSIPSTPTTQGLVKGFRQGNL